MRKQYAYRDTE